MSIDMLPDDVLLEIFDFFVREAYRIEGWKPLVHVCRRWRSVVFGSPLRLNLRLFCSNSTPARDTLDVWPALPLFIECIGRAEIMDDIVAVLERSDSVCKIYLMNLKRSDLGTLSAAMQVPFPELTRLRLWLNDEIDETVSTLPDSFLGGSAPRLEELWLDCIPFPGLPKLLLSASLVTSLSQWGEPHRVYHDAEPGRSEFKFLCFLKMSYMVVPNKEKNHVITKCREQGEQQTFGMCRYTSVSIFHPQ